MALPQISENFPQTNFRSDRPRVLSVAEIEHRLWSLFSTIRADLHDFTAWGTLSVSSYFIVFFKLIANRSFNWVCVLLLWLLILVIGSSSSICIDLKWWTDNLAGTLQPIRTDRKPWHKKQNGCIWNCILRWLTVRKQQLKSNLI